MSEINCHGTEEQYGQPVKGWQLVRLVNVKSDYKFDNFVMGEGDWGLTLSNDPDVVFKLDPMRDNYTDKQVESLPDELLDQQMKVVDHYTEQLNKMEATQLAYLAISCYKSGYDPEEHGALPWWLANRIWEHLQTREWKPENRIENMLSSESTKTDTTEHPALLHCKRLWPNLEWEQHSEGSHYIFSASVPLNLEIRLEIMGDRGARAEVRTNHKFAMGYIFKQSENKLGVSWQEAIHEIAVALQELSNAIETHR